MLCVILLAWLLPLGVTADAQSKISGNQILQKQVTASFTASPVKDVLAKLQQETSVRIVYKAADVERLKPFTGSFKAAPVSQVLDKCLAGTRLTYSVVSGAIVIKSEAKMERITVFGNVKDDMGQPLPGAAVQLKGTTIGAVADIDGNYSIEFGRQEGKENVLIFSFIGMTSEEKSVNSSTQLNVKLTSDSSLEEVVVNGFYTQNMNTFTGVATTIKGEELIAVSPTNLVSGIATLTPGMMLVENNAQGSNPNAVPSLLVRGANSLITNESEEGVNNPLIVLDGVEITMEELYDLDMFDIERIDVLKDASATILYGEKGANGVIVVERKQVKDQKVRLNYNFVPKFSIPDLSSFNLTNAAQKLDFERIAGLYDSDNGSLDKAYDYKLQNVRRGVNTDWIHAPLRIPFSHSHSLALSARGSNVDYRATINLNDTYGVMKADNRRKLGVGFNVGYHLRDKLTVSFRTNFSMTNSKDTPYGTFSDYVALNPYEPIFDENGEYIKNYYFNPFDTNSSRMANPLYDATLSSFSKNQTMSMTNSLSAKWNVTKYFYITGQANMSFNWGSNDDYVSPDAAEYVNLTDPAKRGKYTFSKRNGESYDGKIVLNYGRQIGSRGSMFRISGGSNIKYARNTSATAIGMGFLKDELNDISFAMGYPTSGSPSGTDRIATDVGFFVNGNFSLFNRYFVDASFRTSGSSRFGADNSFAPFWAAGIGWNLHNESFLKDVPWVERLTLRYSTGYTGSVSFDYYQAKTVYEYDPDYQYYTGIGAIPISMGNPNLSWQKKFNNNVGVNATFFKDRLNVAFDWYTNTTYDLLMPINLPPSVGVSSMNVNFGQINNSGFDFSVSGHIISTKDWFWSMTITGGHVMDRINNISTVLKGTEADAVGSEGDAVMPKLLFTEGGSQFDIYAVRSAGIDPATGQEIFIKKDGTYTYKYDEDDRVAVGNSNPVLNGAWINTLRYKGFTLSVTTSYTFGSDFYNTTLQSKVENIDPYKNVDARAYTERWKNPGDLVRYLAINTTNNQMVNSERFVERRNELYVSNVQFTYDFQTRWLNKIGLKRLCLGVGMSDIGYISTVKFERGTSYPYCRSINLIFRPTF